MSAGKSAESRKKPPPAGPEGQDRPTVKRSVVLTPRQSARLDLALAELKSKNLAWLFRELVDGYLDRLLAREGVGEDGENTLEVTLDEGLMAALRVACRRLGVSPEDAAREAIRDCLPKLARRAAEEALRSAEELEQKLGGRP